MGRCTTEGIELIKGSEGCDLIAYRGQDGIWTIGFGHTHGVHQDATCTEDQAYEWLNEDIEITEDILGRCLEVHVNDNQWSALTSFCFNVGFGCIGHKDGFHTLKNGDPSTMLKLLNAGDYSGAANEFPKWDHINGVISQGLLNRRLRERALFLKEV